MNPLELIKLGINPRSNTKPFVPICWIIVFKRIISIQVPSLTPCFWDTNTQLYKLVIHKKVLHFSIIAVFDLIIPNSTLRDSLGFKW